MNRSRRVVVASASVFLLSASLLTTSSGCYERVVRRTDRLGAGVNEVHQPNVKKKGEGEGVVDGVGDVIFGPVQTRKR